MAASEMAYGEGHSATLTEQPRVRTRRAQLSGEFYGDGTDHGFTAPVLPAYARFERIRDV